MTRLRGGRAVCAPTVLSSVSGTFLRSVKPADLEENRPWHVVTLLGDVTDACPGRRQMAELEADADNDISDY